MKKKIIGYRYHKSIVNKLKTQIENADYNLNQERKNHEESKSHVDKLLPNLIRNEVQRDSNFGRYRLLTEIDEYFVHQCFEHGNDQRMIRFVCERLAHQVERELKSLNFRRSVKTI